MSFHLGAHRTEEEKCLCHPFFSSSPRQDLPRPLPSRWSVWQHATNPECVLRAPAPRGREGHSRHSAQGVGGTAVAVYSWEPVPYTPPGPLGGQPDLAPLSTLCPESATSPQEVCAEGVLKVASITAPSPRPLLLERSGSSQSDRSRLGVPPTTREHGGTPTSPVRPVPKSQPPVPGCQRPAARPASSSWSPAPVAGASHAALRPFPALCAPSRRRLPVPSASASPVPGHGSY